jgi:putative ABC transport system permease protein
VLASKFGWKVGDTIAIESAIYPGDWKFEVVAIYKALRKSAARDSLLFDWDYLNEQVPERQKDQIGWIGSRVEDGKGAAEMALVLDAKFDEKDVQTLSQDEGAFMHSFLGMMSTILAAMNVVGVVILGIMMLILGNTVAMGVRERVREYGIMRAVGFLPSHVVTLVVAEAATLGLVGGLVGLAIAVPVVAGMGGFLEENMAAFFPIFRLQAVTALIALGIAIALGALAGALPAYQASRIKVIEALRNVA